MAFPTDLTAAVDNTTDVLAAHINALETKMGVDASAVATSLDYLLKNASSVDPGHKHSELWASDGDPKVIDIDADGKASVTSVIDLLNSAEKITNGGFDSDTTGWTTEECTIASVAGGQDGNCLEITRTGGTGQLVLQSQTFVAGRSYRMTFYVKSGTSGDETFRAGVGEVGVAWSTYFEGASSGTWTQYIFEFVALATDNTCNVAKMTSTAGTMLFDTITLEEIGAIRTNALRIKTPRTPMSATDKGTKGDICWDTGYLYICTADNTWERVAIASW